MFDDTTELVPDTSAETIEVSEKTYNRLKRIGGLLHAETQEHTMLKICTLVENMLINMKDDGTVTMAVKEGKSKRIILDKKKWQRCKTKKGAK